MPTQTTFPSCESHQELQEYDKQPPREITFSLRTEYIFLLRQLWYLLYLALWWIKLENYALLLKTQRWKLTIKCHTTGGSLFIHIHLCLPLIQHGTMTLHNNDTSIEKKIGSGRDYVPFTKATSPGSMDTFRVFKMHSASCCGYIVLL